MHQDIIPLYAADIQDQLKKQFAYLSGKAVVFFPVHIASMCVSARFAFTVFEVSYMRNSHFYEQLQIQIIKTVI